MLDVCVRYLFRMLVRVEADLNSDVGACRSSEYSSARKARCQSVKARIGPSVLWKPAQLDHPQFARSLSLSWRERTTASSMHGQLPHSCQASAQLSCIDTSASFPSVLLRSLACRQQAPRSAHLPASAAR